MHTLSAKEVNPKLGSIHLALSSSLRVNLKMNKIKCLRDKVVDLCNVFCFVRTQCFCRKKVNKFVNFVGLMKERSGLQRH